MNDPEEDYADQLEREERERDLEEQRKNNDDGRTDNEMYDEYETDFDGESF